MSFSILDISKGVALFTDGSSSHIDRSGGWAWLAVDASGNSDSWASAAIDTTNNQMELYAPTNGLNWLYEQHGPIHVLIYSDSKYVILGSQDRNRARKVNQEWWRNLDKAVDQHEHVEWQHVKGHADNFHNEMVDKMAGDARKAGVIINEF